MSLLDGAVGRGPAILELSSHRRILPTYPRIHRSSRFYCNAKISVDDEERKHESSHKGFYLRVPTIPKLADVESARRMLESAFQSLSFDMPRIHIDSALQSFTFDIFKLPIPKQGLVFDITGFVATKLRKPPKHPKEVAVVDEKFYPRCAWPRTLKEAHSGGLSSIETPEILLDQEKDVNCAREESESVYPQLQITGLPLKADLGSKVELGERPCILSSLTGKEAFEAPAGPRSAWPRKTQRIVNADRQLISQSISSNVLYPHSAWPRKSLSRNSIAFDGHRSTVEFDMGSVAEGEVSPCIIEGGARCSWPRKTLPAKRGCDADETTKILPDNVLADPSKRKKDGVDGKLSSASSDGAAELPRRMLATSAALSVMNQLTKGSFGTSLFDFCSLLPAGNLEFVEGEDTAFDVGRRTLLVFIKQSSG